MTKHRPVIWIAASPMETYYKKHRIRSTAYQIPENHHWTWKALVSEEAKPTLIHQLDGAGEKHRTEQEAEVAAIPVVKVWIDHGKPKLGASQ